MASDVVMPRLSDSMEEGTVLKWLIDEGGEVKRGEPLVEIETDKANMTYDSDADGVLIEIVAQEGDTLPIGEVIARIGEAGEAKQSAEEERRRGRSRRERGRGDRAGGRQRGGRAGEKEEPKQEPAIASAGSGGGETESGAGTATKAPPAGGNGDGRVKASPVARRMARELGVELAALEGTGPGGRIVKADVQAAADNGGAATKEAPAEAPDRGAAETQEREEPAEERRVPKPRRRPPGPRPAPRARPRSRS